MTPLSSFRSRLLKASLGAAAALAASAPAPARACSMIAGWLRPTNYELVRGAEAIVLARSGRGPSPAAAWHTTTGWTGITCSS